jgi:hypothetical protein
MTIDADAPGYVLSTHIFGIEERHDLAVEDWGLLELVVKSFRGGGCCYDHNVFCLVQYVELTACRL